MKLQYFLSILSSFFICQQGVLAEIADATAITVNDHVILESEITRATTNSRQEAMDSLINDKLLEDEAIRLGLDIEERLAQTLNGIMAERHLDEAGFERALVLQGTTLAQFKAQLRKQLYKLRVIQEIKNTVTVDSQEVSTLLRGQSESGKLPCKAHLKQLLFTNSLAAHNAFKSLPTDHRLEPSAWEKFAQNIQSKDSRVQSKDLGFIVSSDLMGDFEKSLLNSSERQVFGPLQSEQGWHLIYVDKKFPLEQKTLVKVGENLHNELYEKRIEEALSKYVAELRASSYVRMNNKAK